MLRAFDVAIGQWRRAIGRSLVCVTIVRSRNMRPMAFTMAINPALLRC